MACRRLEELLAEPAVRAALQLIAGGGDSDGIDLRSKCCRSDDCSAEVASRAQYCGDCRARNDRERRRRWRAGNGRDWQRRRRVSVAA